MSYVGDRLIYELSASNIIVKYGSDKNVAEIVSSLDDLENVDVIIVTSIFS